MKLKKFGSIAVFCMLMAIVISGGYRQVYAEKPSTTGWLIQHEEYTVQELVPSNDSNDAPLIPVEVHYVSKSYEVPLFSEEGADNNLTSSFVVTERRNIAEWRMNEQCYNFQVKSGAQTETSICVSDEVYVKVRTAYPGGETSSNDGTDWLGCKSNTGWKYVQNTFGQGTNDVKTRGDHRAKHNGVTHEWLNQDGPSVNLPYEHACTG